MKIYQIDNGEVVTVAANNPEEAFGLWAEYHMRTCYKKHEDGRVTVADTAWPDESPAVTEVNPRQKLVIREIAEQPLEILAMDLADFIQHPQFICTTEF